MNERLEVKREVLHEAAYDDLVTLACASSSLEPGGTLRPLTGGCHSNVYVYEAPNGKLVVRTPGSKDCGDTIKADYNLLLELDGCRAPRPIALAEIQETPVALIEFIEGGHKEDFNSLAPEEIDELAQAMAEFHAKTSGCYSDRSGIQPTHTGTHADYLWAMVCEAITSRLQSHGASLCKFPGADQLFKEGLRRLEEIVALHPDDFSGTTFCRLHHDLNPGNVIWQPDGRVVFIDANPTYGDPCDDVNYVVSNNGGSAEFQKKLLAAYAHAAPGVAISPSRMEAYTLKNWLDDLAWAIDMCEKYKDDPDTRSKYEAAYANRAEALGQLLAGA